MYSKVIPFWICLGLTAALSACKHDPVIPDNFTDLQTDTSCNANVVYFKNDIEPLLAGSCAYTGCHDANSAADGVNLSNYNSILTTGEVRPGNASRSELYEVVEKNEMPPGNPLTAAQKDLLKNWINQGARNNACIEAADTSTACNTSAVTFNLDVGPVIAANCRSCHNASFNYKNVVLESYTQIQAIANDGRLVGTIKGQGYALMPPGNQLSDCDIQKIEAWVAAGAPNN